MVLYATAVYGQDVDEGLHFFGGQAITELAGLLQKQAGAVGLVVYKISGEDGEDAYPARVGF